MKIFCLCQWCFALYLWREFEVVRRRLPTAFLASVGSGKPLHGLGGLFPSRLAFADTGCSMLSSRSHKHNSKQKVNYTGSGIFLHEILFMHRYQFGHLLPFLLLSLFLFSSLDFSNNLFFLKKRKKYPSWCYIQLKLWSTNFSLNKLFAAIYIVYIVLFPVLKSSS